MKVKYLADVVGFETYILAGDIGGTHSNLALVGKAGDSFKVLIETATPTAEITDFLVIFKQSLEIFLEKLGDATIFSSCISAAGPVSKNYCQLTNASWAIDGNQVESETGIVTRVVNDFIALSYGIPLLDINNPESICQFRALDGSYPTACGKNKAIIGAGTGLGVGFLPWVKDYYACPSEGGHFDFPAFDDETTELMLYMRKKLGFHPGVERLVSGEALGTIFNWLLKMDHPEKDEIIESIIEADEVDKPYYISKNVESHLFCEKVHRLFRKIYGKMAGNYATVFLPKGGLYIAGGVIAKDERHFLSDSTFMDFFSINHKENISHLLKSIPVYIVRDYSTSLLGAANAALH